MLKVHAQSYCMRFVAFAACFLLNCPVFAQRDSAITVSRDSGYFSSFDGTKIYYEVHGSGKPVLLIHGFIVNGSTWRGTPLLKELTGNGFQVITMDLRGNGKSDKPRNEQAYADDAEVKDLIGLAGHLHLAAYDAVGYSRGSIIAARLLVLDKRVRKAVLGGMGTGFTNPQWPRRLLFYGAFGGKPVKELEGLIATVKRRGLDTAVLANLQKYQPTTLPSALKKIRQPVLIISGDADADNGSAPDLAKMFRNATTVTVPGDHDHTAGTAAFASEVVLFLKR